MVFKRFLAKSIYSIVMKYFYIVYINCYAVLFSVDHFNKCVTVSLFILLVGRSVLKVAILLANGIIMVMWHLW